MKATLLLVAATIACCSAHMCLLFPHQRGTANDLNTKGADDCLLVSGPCGGRDPDTNQMTQLMAGSKVNFIFQKNLDHFNSASPGNFTLRINSTDDITKTTVLGTVPDSADAPSGYLYSASLMIPSDMSGKAIIQGIYYTQNPKAPPFFYQCADVMIMKPSRAHPKL